MGQPEVEENAEQNAKKRMRSPNFPYMHLEAAIGRTRELHSRDKTYPVPMVLVHDRWGYNKMSGALQQTVAALLAYGLVEVSGTGDKRQVKVSDIGRMIVLGHASTLELVKQAAVKPKVFGHLWEKYKEQGLPQDDVIRQYLLFDYEFPFNEDSVDACIARFKDTITYAKLSNSDIIIPEGGGDSGNNPDPAAAGTEKPAKPAATPPPAKGNMKNFAFPLESGDVVTITAPHPMTEDDFDMLLTIMQAAKRGFLGPKKPITDPVAEWHGIKRE